MGAMHEDPALVLRDIHVPPPPPWWPPAPGWWLLAALLLLVVAVVAWMSWRRRRQKRALQRMFDAAIDAAPTAAARVAMMSELLRRAAIHRDRSAATLHGREWLALLDKDASQPLFEGAHGQLLLEGGFRAEVDEAAAADLRLRARRRFLEWMDAR